MAFIREYMEAGDPFRFRLPKKLRKFQPGKALRRIAPAALSFVPGVGGAVDFARAYGMMGDPGPRPQKKRKMAGAGPKAKAAKKKVNRAQKVAKAKAKGPAIDWSKVMQKGAEAIPVVGGIAGELYGQYSAAHAQAAAAGVPPDLEAPALPYLGGKKGFHFPGMRHHRRMNPANVKALRRSVRRVEGFHKLVKSIEKAMPRLRPMHHHHFAAAPAKRRGK